MLWRVTVGAEQFLDGHPERVPGPSRDEAAEGGPGPRDRVAATFVAVGCSGFVAATFLLGWLSGLLLVLKSWHLFHATGWLMVSGAGYVTLMLIPIMAGFACARIAGHLVRRGWSGAPLRVLALGVCGLVAGVMAI
jgi:hypothetical protein